MIELGMEDGEIGIIKEKQLLKEFGMVIFLGLIVVNVGAFLGILWFRHEQRRLDYCPRCGTRLSPLKENQNGWLYKDCLSLKCTIVAISWQRLLEGKPW